MGVLICDSIDRVEVWAKNAQSFLAQIWVDLKNTIIKNRRDEYYDCDARYVVVMRKRSRGNQWQRMIFFKQI